ncbi:MAG: DNA adenine methylase [Thiothrix lacustris]|uniref:Site-specific DNA-methyltransferase (adenine-specific) n=1 Tax=Thiothrix lacustris TaxID=525917 RepID=A0A1Y1QQU1_9GAMM|nr:MAG: DNA adenine methylase [Thiothrix lacustris]
MTLTSRLSSPSYPPPRPLLKWVGGKSQLLETLLAKMPQRYGRYIEPFIGGGALFFAVQPEEGIIADSNPELVNLYQAIANDVEAVIHHLKVYRYDKDLYYITRSLDWQTLEPAQAAARTIYLNRTCFNGLYRVNQRGQFNVPFGKYTNPTILDANNLRSAAALLSRNTILCADYKTILREHTQPGDFIFLDPPYLPISTYADFKRYTKEQFHEEEHIELATEVTRLHEQGCHVILTNSNHPLVHDLYGKFSLDVLQTKRYISCNGKKREGQDVVVKVPPKKNFGIRLLSTLPTQVGNFPSTRYMGSKSKLLSEIWAIASQFEFDSVCDLFAGSGVVSYLFKSQGKQVISNDYMAMSNTLTKALIENNNVQLSAAEAINLLTGTAPTDRFVETTFAGLYFNDDDNRLIDRLRDNIKTIHDPYKQAIARAALIRACVKKRPRGIFTYTGNRYDDGRKDLKLSFEEQFLQAVSTINAAVFDNGKVNKSLCKNSMEVSAKGCDLVYLDPPYYSPYSDNEYVRRYHFVEGIARDWEGVEIQEHTLTKKFKSYPTPFSSRKGATEAFDLLFKHFKNSILIVSYSSNSQPTKDEMLALMSRYKEHVEVVPINYQYSIGNQGNKVMDNKNTVQEYLFVGY